MSITADIRENIVNIKIFICAIKVFIWSVNEVQILKKIFLKELRYNFKTSTDKVISE